ncbi:hypothetical protein [Actinoplanes sp. DH11]|uniref:hypothetical protein n=1 Tax=Actinoplanes sp. DH11 TaxID=2857011 RepID=UPI001E4B9B8C|nr:hypothetical protein [Actinoplanes sp. DH11]
MNVAPVAISLVLLVLTLPALLLLAEPRALRDPRLAAVQTLGAVRRARRDRSRDRDQALETVRWAAEVRVAAERATDAARRWQECRWQAEEHTEDAWQAWQDAELRLDRLRSAEAFTAPDDARTPADFADRERALHRMLRAAIGRGDLPADAVRWDGWDPALHPVLQEVAVQRAIAGYRHRAYRTAVTAEQAARHDERLAVEARDSLRRTAAEAARQVADVRPHLPAAVRAAVPARVRGWRQRIV